jgi:hypothetical protein
VLGVEAWALYMLGKHYNTELQFPAPIQGILEISLGVLHCALKELTLS